MVRPRNNKKKSEILHCAIELFRKNGYTNTSYQAIAQHCNESRALVQHYFPKKTEFVTSFFAALSVNARDILLENNRITENKFVNYYLIGLLYFEYLATNEETKLFVSDILGDRSLSDEVLLLTRGEISNFLQEDSYEESNWTFKSILLRGGGLLTYIHYWMLKNVDMDIEPIVRENVVERMIKEEYSSEDADALLKKYRLSTKDTKLFTKQLDQRLSSQFCS